MSIATDVRAYADTALEQGRAVLGQASTQLVTANKRLINDAPKPAYAALGAANLVAAKVTKRVETLPGDAVATAGKAQQTSTALLTKTQQDAFARVSELRGRFDAGIDQVTSLPMVARKTGQAYLTDAKELFGKLTAVGEARAAELRNDPRVTRVLGDLNDAATTAAAPVVGKVRSKVQPVVKSAFDSVPSVEVEVVETTPAKRPVRKTTTKSAAVKTTGTKVTGRASSTTTPVKKASARKTTARATKSAPAKVTKA